MRQEEIAEVLRIHEDWIYGRASGRRADLRGADLRDADLRNKKLCLGDLHGADLHGADLSGADLHNADLSGGNLCFVNIRGANLHGANLSDANLRGASLQDINLRNADLTGADLRGATGVTLLPVGHPRGYRPVAVWHRDHWMVAAGRRWYTVEQARNHWSAPEYHTPRLGQQYVAALDWLEAETDTLLAEWSKK